MQFILENSIQTPFDATYCNSPWIAVNKKTAGLSANGKICPNPNYPKTREYACQLVFGCCDGKPLADVNLAKVQECATSQAFDKICESCTSLCAVDSVKKFHQFAFYHMV